MNQTHIYQDSEDTALCGHGLVMESLAWVTGVIRDQVLE